MEDGNNHKDKDGIEEWPLIEEDNVGWSVQIGTHQSPARTLRGGRLSKDYHRLRFFGA